MIRAVPTPTDLAIPLRDLRFEHDRSRHARWWLGGNPAATAFFNALSCTFPAGEKFFMDSVRHFRREVDEPLRSQITGFIAQESVHSREHAAFNKLAADSGYDVAALELRIRKVLDFARTRSRAKQLAATCALEHFTAILAHQLLTSDSHDLDGAPEAAIRLWSWHAMEEIEHKAVAYDTFLAVTRQWSPARRYLLRTHSMLLATMILFSTITANMRDLYREDGLKGRRIWWQTIVYLFGRGGILRRIIPDYLRYFRPGFHPWLHDDRDLLGRTAARLDMDVAA